MQTNDLPLAQQLAALLEAGRACNPNKKHIQRVLVNDDGFCATGFIAAALGLDVSHGGTAWAVGQIAEKLGVERGEVSDILERVIYMNDSLDASVDEIAEAIRTDTLPDGIQSAFGYITISASSFLKLYPQVHSDGENITFTQAGKSEPRPAKAVRQSAKTGATWPAPKHAYA